MSDHFPRLHAHKGAAVGRCNICLKEGPLTEDHVPPKGTIKARQVDLMPVVLGLQLQDPRLKKQKRFFQNGVFYKSICAGCNNGLLGALYDPALIHFCNQITTFLTADFVRLPLEVKVKGKPGLIARAVLGHLLAVGVNRTEKTPCLNLIRNYVLDPQQPFPEQIEIYYWPYPFKKQVLIRDAGFLRNFFGHQPVVFWCLKFPPVAFMVTLESNLPHLTHAPRLRDSILHIGDHETDIPLRLYGVPEATWPEAPEDDGAVFFGDAACMAMPRADQSRR